MSSTSDPRSVVDEAPGREVARPADAPVHPVLAEILREEEPDTVSWVKG